MDDQSLGHGARGPDPIGGSGPELYEIRVRGELDASWAEWLGGLELRWGGDGTTILTGPVADQAALHGLLARVRDLAVSLLAVNRLDLDRPQGSAR